MKKTQHKCTYNMVIYMHNHGTLSLLYSSYFYYAFATSPQIRCVSYNWRMSIIIALSLGPFPALQHIFYAAAKDQCSSSKNPPVLHHNLCIETWECMSLRDEARAM